MKRFLVVLALAASPAVAQYPPTPGTGHFTTIEALEYANVGGEALLLDLRIPEGRGPHPVIIYLHSGAWITGDRTGGPAIRQASRGYAVASIEYRLAPQYTWPAQIEDCKAAVRWVRANAARFNLDPERIGVFGTSAGGHLGAILGTSGGVESLEGPQLGNAQYSSRVKAVVDFYGPTDLLKLDEQKLPCLPLDGNSPFMPPSLLMGCPIQQCKEKTMTASPMSYITRDDPPFLIMHGMLDCLVSFQQSVDLHRALEANGVSSTLVLLPKGEHGGKAFDEQKIKEQISDWLDKNLRGPIVPARRRAVGAKSAL
jgi:acetyl esterase/lipase